jgi:hypothetical protein
MDPQVRTNGQSFHSCNESNNTGYFGLIFDLPLTFTNMWTGLSITVPFSSLKVENGPVQYNFFIF